MESSSPDPTVQIRRAVPEEWRQWRELRLEALRTDPMAFGSTLEREVPFPPELWQERLARNPSAPGCGSWIAVDASGRWIGMGVTADLEGQVHVFAMWVHPEARGRGVGARLLDAALHELGRSEPERSIVLEVNPRQRAAQALYLSRGFRPTGRSSPLGHHDPEQVVELRRDPPPR
jgi:ribosomal protein S18 acetylase RimI-like enzyme